MSDRTAIVTGAAAGIGRRIAERAALAGYRVGVLDLSPEITRAAAAHIAGSVALVADVSDEDSVASAFDTLGAVPDLVVNNAGIVRFGPLLELAANDWRSVVDVNLTGTFLVAREAARRMQTRGSGAIVNVTSMNGVAPGPNSGAYGATKAAVALMTQQMALEWGPLGIRVNAVAPGLIDGGMSAAIYADPEVRAARESKVPLGRLGEPDDIANAVLFLASDQADYISGQNLLVDGGVTMGMIGQLPRPASVEKTR